MIDAETTRQLQALIDGRTSGDPASANWDHFSRGLASLQLDSAIDDDEPANTVVINGVFDLATGGHLGDANKLACTMAATNPIRALMVAVADKALLAWAGVDTSDLRTKALRLTTRQAVNLFIWVGAYNGSVDMLNFADLPETAPGYTTSKTWLTKVWTLETTCIILDSLGDNPVAWQVFATLLRDNPVAGEIPGSIIAYGQAAGHLAGTH